MLRIIIELDAETVAVRTSDAEAPLPETGASMPADLAARMAAAGALSGGPAPRVPESGGAPGFQQSPSIPGTPMSDLPSALASDLSAGASPYIDEEANPELPGGA